jgi:hypothetical protein
MMTAPVDSLDKDAMIAALLARVEELMATNACLVARVAELEAKLDQPPKTPTVRASRLRRGGRPPKPPSRSRSLNGSSV